MWFQVTVQGRAKQRKALSGTCWWCLHLVTWFVNLFVHRHSTNASIAKNNFPGIWELTLSKCLTHAFLILKVRCFVCEVFFPFEKTEIPPTFSYSHFISLRKCLGCYCLLGLAQVGGRKLTLKTIVFLSSIRNYLAVLVMDRNSLKLTLIKSVFLSRIVCNK